MKRLRELNLPLKERTLGGLLARKARENANRTLLLFEGQRYTYSESDKISNRIANGLLAAGIKPGDHVATLIDNRPEALWSYFGLGKIGAVAVPINTASKGELLCNALAHSEATTLIVEHAHLERYLKVQAGCPLIRHLIVIDDTDSKNTKDKTSRRITTWSELLDANSTPPDVAVSFKDTYLLMYTSGTTGPSKGSLSPHAYPITYGMQRAEAFGYQPEDVLYTCLPLFHGNALIGTCFSALVADASIALARRFSARNFWQDIRTTRATQCNLLGAMVNILWQLPASTDDRQHMLRQCTVVPMPEFAPDFEDRYGLKLTSIYALSDYGMGTLLPPDHPKEKIRSAGLPAHGVEIAILDDDDIPVCRGEVGQIALRSREPWTTSQGYWRMADATLQSRRNLWFHSGDRGYLDNDGYLYFVDRQKDAIRRRGENISSWELEKIVQRHPAVQEVAAFGVQAEMAEDEVMISVVCRPDCDVDPAELIAFCQERMAYFMVPRYIEFVDTLPRTMTQKIEKYKLKAQAQARLSELWDREQAGIALKR